jgi:hypothetical protein
LKAFESALRTVASGRFVFSAFEASAGRCGFENVQLEGKETHSETVAKAFGIACVECVCGLGCWKAIWIPVAVTGVAWLAHSDGFRFLDVS